MLFLHTLRVVILILLSAASFRTWAETVLVAVASNFTKPMNEIAAAFNKTTGHKAALSFGSSGKFVAQIEHGAPFEVFLSADQVNPKKLEQAGLAIAERRFTYAIGKLVLWSADSHLVDKKGQVLNKGGFQHIALADPKLAAYGLAAQEALIKLGLWDKLTPFFVLGENISQTQQFISTGNAELGFIALSQVIEYGKINSGSFWLVPEELHTPLRQDATLLKKGESNPAARALLGFLKSPEATLVIKSYGYDLVP